MAIDSTHQKNKEQSSTGDEKLINQGGGTPPPADPPIGELAYKKAEENERRINKISEEINFPKWSKQVISSVYLLSFFLKTIILLFLIFLLIGVTVFLVMAYINFKILIDTMEDIRSKIGNVKDFSGLENLYFFTRKWLNVYVFSFIGLSGLSTISFFIIKCIEKIGKRK